MRPPTARRPFRVSLLLLATLGAAACVSESTAVAYTQATIWDGTGRAPYVGTLVVDSGRIVAAGTDVEAPPGAAIVVLEGRYVLPGMIDAHAHVTGAWAPDDVADPVARVRADLLLFARYGVTTVNSLGDEPPTLQARDADPDPRTHARVLAAGPVIAATDPAAARADALAHADAGVDWLKVRVDDELGTVPKMPWDAVAAVIEAGRERGLRVATHLYYLDDAKRLLQLGTGLLAHSVRDRDVDAELLDMVRASGVCYVPTLVRDLSTFVYASRPEWFDDPFFLAHAHRGQVEATAAPDFVAGQRSPAAATYRAALARAQRNLKVLSDAGLPIAFGTDAGPAARFPGYFEHLELALMVDAGLTPEQALISATSGAARCLGLDEVGTLEPGRRADFLVLGADPLVDIVNTRRLEGVYVGGARIEGPSAP
ncbi:MAG: amidohydrolase family protein [Gemmatimonadales bacterium]